MAFYNTLAALFLFGTIIMVAGTFFMGFLHWKEERLLPDPVKAKRPKAVEASPATASLLPLHDAGDVKLHSA